MQNPFVTTYSKIPDNSYIPTEQTLEIVEKLRETNQRIILINNKKNMGILYSRSIAILRAKGEYIMNLDTMILF